MNAITLALAEAGVPLPTSTQRIWAAIKDHPGSSQSELRERLKAISPGSFSSLLTQMEARGMVYSRLEPRTDTKRGPLKIKRYYTDLLEYKPLPAPPRNNKSSAPKAVVLAAEPVAVSFDADLDKLVDNLTIKQARALMAKLRGMFS